MSYNALVWLWIKFHTCGSSSVWWLAEYLADHHQLLTAADRSKPKDCDVYGVFSLFRADAWRVPYD